MTESYEELLTKIEELRRSLAESNDLLRAIRSGEVDALVVSRPEGDQVYTLEGADRAYRVLIEAMNDGAVTLTSDGTILYCNRHFAQMVKSPLEKVLGSSIYRFILEDSKAAFMAILRDLGRGELTLRAEDESVLPVYMSFNALQISESQKDFCLVVTDLTDQKHKEEIVAAERLARSIIEQATEAVVVCDDNGKIIRFSNAVSRILGYDPSLKSFDDLFDLQLPTGKKLYPVSAALQGDVLQQVETSLERFDGVLSNLILNAGPLRGTNGKIIGCVVTLTDITERKKAEEKLVESEERYKLLFESANDGIVLHEMTAKGLPGDILQVNKVICRMLGYTKEEMIRLKPMDLQLEGSDEAGEELQKILSHEKTILFERNLVTKDGRCIPVEFHTSVIDLQGNPAALSIIRDITERKRAEIALQESEQRYSTTLASIGDAVIATDIEGKITFMNAVAEELTGWTLDETMMLPAKAVFNIINEYTRQKVDDPITKVLGNGVIVGLANHTILIRKDGTEVAIDDSGAPIKDRNGNATGVVLVFRDITERRRMVAALRESEENYRTIVETANEGIWVVDPETKTTYVNRRMAEMLGYSPEEMIGKTSSEFMDEEGKARLGLMLERRRQGINESFEFKFLRRDGSTLWAISSAAPLRDKDGKFVGSLGMLTDITDRKLMEEELRKSEEKYRTAIDFTCDWETWQSPEGNYIYVSPSCERITGYSADNFLTDPEFIEKIVHPDDRELFSRHFNNVDDAQSVDFRIITRNGEERWISHVCQSVYSSDGHYLGRRASNRDITDQRRIEEALRETQDYLENLIDYANAPIIVWDTSFNITRFNRAFEVLTGLEAQDVLGKPLEILFPDSSKEDSLALIRRTSSGERWDAVEIPILMTDGSVRTVLWNSANIYDKDRNAVVAPIAQGQDITDRKRAEKALEDAVTNSERDRSQLEAIFAAQNDAVIIYDTKMNVQRANKSFIETYGFGPVGLNLRDIIQRVSCRWLDGRPFLLDEQPTPRALRGEKVVGECFMVTRADGAEVAVETSSGPIRAEDRIIGSVTVWRDITERVRAEEVLRLNEEKAGILSNVTSRLLASDNPQGIVEELCLRVMDFLDCHAFFNYLVDEERGRLHLNACAGISTKMAREIEWLDYGAAVCGCAARDGERIVAQNIPETSDPRTDLVKSLGIKAYACHPLMNRGQVIGTLSFGT
ncbi:MAG: PAS domain S-box protein, partial [Methanotrichaceae archaeon]